MKPLTTLTNDLQINLSTEETISSRAKAIFNLELNPRTGSYKMAAR